MVSYSVMDSPDFIHVLNMCICDIFSVLRWVAVSWYHTIHRATHRASERETHRHTSRARNYKRENEIEERSLNTKEV